MSEIHEWIVFISHILKLTVWLYPLSKGSFLGRPFCNAETSRFRVYLGVGCIDLDGPWEKRSDSWLVIGNITPYLKTHEIIHLQLTN